jgi:tetratricopeptide (TPR) repeat protein
MSDRNESTSGLKTFLNESSALILAVISLISGVYGFVKLFADKDAGLVTLISLAVGVLLLLGICLYYARFWQPEHQDGGRSAFEPLSDELIRVQAQKQRQRQRVRRSAVVGLILIPLLSLSGVAGWQHVQSLPIKDIIVLVAEFDGPDPKTYGVTETVIRQLRQATEKYPDVKIQALNQTITEQQGSTTARTEGEKRKATIVIWGWYRNPGEVVPLSVNFEVLRPPQDLPNLGQNAKGGIQQAAIADLKNFTLQTRLSNEMSYLSLFTLGMARYAAADWEGAIARFSDALNQKTESSSGLNQSIVYFYRGVTYLFQGSFDRALADLNQAIKLDPTSAEAYANRVTVYLAKGDYSHALADANQAIKLKPDLFMAHNNRGMIYLTTGNYDGAIADFSQTLKLLPADTLSAANNDADSNFSDQTQISTSIGSDGNAIFSFLFNGLDDYLAYNNRGSAYLFKKDYDRAIADFNQAIKLQPDRINAYLNRAAAYLSKQDYDRALADVNRVIQLQPDFALAYVNRATVYLLKQDYERGLEDLSQAIKLQPNLAFAYLKRGAIYDTKGDDELALKDYNEAIKLQPNSGTSYTVRGDLYSDKGGYDRAIADFNQAIKLQPDSADAYRSRGRSYREKRNYDRAIVDFNQAIKLEPGNADLYNSRGWTYAQKGDYDRAIVDLNRAIKLNPNEADFYDSRGFAYAGKGDSGRAIADYNQALKLKPDADYAYYHRGIVYRKLGRNREAIADFKKTLELTQDAKRRQDAEKQLRELGVP